MKFPSFASIIFLGLLVYGGVALGADKMAAPLAESGVLDVQPYRLIIENGQKTSVISIANKSDKPHRYILKLVNQVMDKNGLTRREDTFRYSLKGMVRFAPKSFLIQPEETQTVRVVVERPQGLADGDYHSHLIFSEPGVADTIYSIAMPIIVQQGEVSGDMGISDAVINALANGERQMTVRFTRTGNAEAAIKIKAEYTAPGKSPVEVMDPQWIRMYREVDTVTKSFMLGNIPPGAQGGKVVIRMIRDETNPQKFEEKEIPFD